MAAREVSGETRVTSGAGGEAFGNPEILGEPAKNWKWDYGIVIQGPYIKNHTDIVIRQYLERNGPRVLVIVSTYVSAKDQLSTWAREIISTGRVVYLFTRCPSVAENPSLWKTNFWNQNLQRLSSYVGLTYAHGLGIELSMKSRSDVFLGRYEICHYLASKFVLGVPPLPSAEDIPGAVKGRIVFGDHGKIPGDHDEFAGGRKLGKYHLMDQWFFGWTEDLMHFFDIREGAPEICTRNPVETNLTERWIRQVGIRSAELAELAGRYLAVGDSVEVEFLWIPRWHSYERYLKQGKKHLIDADRDQRRRWGPMLTHERWLGLVEKYR